MYIVVYNVKDYNYYNVVRELDSLGILWLKTMSSSIFYLLADSPKLSVLLLNYPPMIVFISLIVGQSSEASACRGNLVGKVDQVVLHIVLFYSEGIYPVAPSEWTPRFHLGARYTPCRDHGPNDKDNTYWDCGDVAFASSSLPQVAALLFALELAPLGHSKGHKC